MHISGIKIHNVMDLHAESGHTDKASWLSIGELAGNYHDSKVTFFLAGPDARNMVNKLAEAINTISGEYKSLHPT